MAGEPGEVAAVIFEMTVPSPLPLSANQRMHKLHKARVVRETRDRAEDAARSWRGFPILLETPTHCTVHIGWPTRHRRDEHNAYPTIKACIDGIVRAGWLPDDDSRYLIGPDLRGYYAGLAGVTVLRFQFEPATGDEPEDWTAWASDVVTG